MTNTAPKSTRVIAGAGVPAGVYLIPALAPIIAIVITLAMFTTRTESNIPPNARATNGPIAQLAQSVKTVSGAARDCYFGWTEHPQPPPCMIANADAINYSIQPIPYGFFAAIAACAVPWAIIAGFAGRPRTRMPPKPKERFSLFLGRSTGTLTELGHGAGIDPDHDVILDGEDAAMNIIVFGGIGSGKTASEMNSLTEQAIEQDCGILFLDVKGDAGLTLDAYAEQYGKPVTSIGVGPGAVRMDLLRDLTPEVAASFLQSALMLIGLGQGAGAVYLNVAVEYAKNVLGLLQFDPSRYNLKTLRDCVFDPERSQLIIEAIRKSVDGDAEKRARFQPYYDYIANIFPDYEPRIQNSVKQSLSQILDAFKAPEIQRAFCESTADSESMLGLLDGRIYKLDLPLALYGVSGKTIYAMVQLRFMNLMQRRPVEPTWNQERYVVMIADEYQEVIPVADPPALSARSFFDKSRSAKTIGIVAMQGWSSAEAAIGDKVLTDATLQNFRQKICFSNEDLATIDYFTRVIGKAEVAREIVSKGRSRRRIFETASASQQIQTRTSLEDVVTAQVFRTHVGAGRALALLQLDRESYDDVILTPYSEPKVSIADRAPIPEAVTQSGRALPS